MTVNSTLCRRFLRMRPAIQRKPAEQTDYAIRPTPSAARQLNHDIGRFHRCDGYDACSQPELVNRLPCDQRDDPIRTGLHLDLGCDAVLDNSSDDANETVPG